MGGWHGACGFSCPESLAAVLKVGPAFSIHTVAHQALLGFVLGAPLPPPAPDLLSCFSAFLLLSSHPDLLAVP